MRRREKEIIDENELNEIMHGAGVCRIALNDEGSPYMVAMNYGYSEPDDSIYFHCSKKGRKIDLIKKDNRVSFQIDTSNKLISTGIACECTMKYKSIFGRGNIQIVDGEAERVKGLNVIMDHYTGKDDYTFDERIMKNTCILKLEISEKTGKKNI